jgi:DNA-binding Lrp family transcriptional regulator
VVTAYILIQTEVGKAAKVAKDIAEITGVQQAEDVTGPYDVIVRAQARNLDELGKLGRLARDEVHDQIKFQAASTCCSMKVSRAWLKPRQATASGVRRTRSGGRAGSNTARPGARTRP